MLIKVLGLHEMKSSPVPSFSSQTRKKDKTVQGPLTTQKLSKVHLSLEVHRVSVVIIPVSTAKSTQGSDMVALCPAVYDSPLSSSSRYESRVMPKLMPLEPGEDILTALAPQIPNEERITKLVASLHI